MERTEKLCCGFNEIAAGAQRRVATYASKTDQPFVLTRGCRIKAKRLCGRIMAGKLPGRFNCAGVRQGEAKIDRAGAEQAECPIVVNRNDCRFQAEAR